MSFKPLLNSNKLELFPAIFPMRTYSKFSWPKLELKQANAYHTHQNSSTTNLTVSTLGSMCLGRSRFSRDLVGEIPVKARGQGTGEGREGFQIMIQVGHLGKEEREGRSVGEGERQT